MLQLLLALSALMPSQPAHAANSFKLTVVNQTQTPAQFCVFQQQVTVTNQSEDTVVLSLYEQGREVNRLTLPAHGADVLLVRGVSSSVTVHAGGNATAPQAVTPCARTLVVSGL